jgi:hypothetical protein
MIGWIALSIFLVFVWRSVEWALGWEDAKDEHGVLGAYERQVARNENAAEE